MKNLMVAFISIALGACAHAPSQATDGEAPPGAIQALESFHRALAAGDRDAALARLADDVVIFESGGVEASREEYASHHLESDLAFAAATDRTVFRQRSGSVGDRAWVLTESATEGTFRNRDIESDNVETALLERRGGRWLITHVHWSSRERR